MKIISIVEGASTKSGIREIRVPGAVNISKALKDLGHQVVVCMGGEVVPEHEEYKKRMLNDVLDCTGIAFGIVPFPATEFWSFSPTLVKGLLRNAKKADFIILHSLYSFPVLAGYLMARKYKKPYAIFLHGVLAPIQRTKSRRKKWAYDRLIGRKILNQASMVVYTAGGEFKETLPLHLTAPAALIPLGMHAQDYACMPPRGQFRARFLSGFNGPIVLYLGRLHSKKGLDLLVEAMKQVIERRSDVRLVIVGGGDPPSFKSLVGEWVRASNLESQTLLTGPITKLEEKKQVFADADVFVLPSHAENFGFAMFEAMACRVPVVITDTLNYASEVNYYEAGLVVSRDTQEIAKAILRLLDDSSLRLKLGENGLRLVQAYSWDATGEKLDRAIKSILDGQPIPTDLFLQ